jgi:tripartite-type tricarboxylate transporter receptor subunit TctC
MRTVLELPEIKDKLIGFGGSPQASTPAEFRARVEHDIESLRKVATQRKIEAE